MNVTAEEEEILKNLVDQGIDVTIQMVPEDAAVPVMKAL